uniref:Uncharacterized protein n=1 Tax=Hucho hucho TaxID=62062 RepID=A0A4W5MH12_9TELE
METLVYETACELSLTLRDLQHLSDIDKLRLLMKNSSAERYVKDVFQWMVPFLHRCEKQIGGASEALLREYLVTLSRQDLSLPLAVFQHSRPDVSIHTPHTHRAVPCRVKVFQPGGLQDVH